MHDHTNIWDVIQHNWNDIMTWGWVTSLAAAGGFVNFYNKFRRGEVARFNIGELLGDLLTSAFAGWCTYLMCRGAGINEHITAGLVGISGHMGSRIIFVFEKWLSKRLETILGGNKND
jgi:hypothetical protein